MPTFNGRNFTGIPGLNIREVNGAIRFETPLTTPTTTSGERLLYVNSSNQLIFNDGSSAAIIGSGGGGGTPTWETIFALDNTFTVTPDAVWTIAGNRNTATNVVSMTNVAGASGAILAFTNTTNTNNDLLGTASSWAVTGTGAATFLTLTLTGTTITSTGADLAWAVEDNDATALSIGANGITNMLVFDTRTGVEVVSVSAGGFAVVNGAATFGSTSNTVANVAITNNTISTFGANTNNTGALVVTSTSITTGSLFQLNLSDTNNAGGFYLNCRETVGGTNDFTIGENGVITMAGTASTTSLTMTLGNLLLSDGTISVTSTGTADVISVTANNLLANNAMILQGSGAFTGTTTNSFMVLNPTGLTTGTALYIAGAAATLASILVDATQAGTTGAVMRLVSTGVLVDGAASGILTMVADSATTAGATAGRGIVSLSVDGLTTGTGVDITSTSLGLAAGELLNVEHIVSGTITAAKTGQLVDVTSSRTHTAASAISDDYDGLSIVRTNVVNNAGGTLNAAGSALYIENVGTQTAGTLADTANALEIVMTGGATQTGYGISIAHSGTTGGRAISIAASQTTGTVMLMTANALTTTGVGLSITNTAGGGGSALTSGSLIRVTTDTAGAVITNGVVSLRATGAYTSTVNAGLLDIVASALVGTGTIVNIQATNGSQLTNTALNVQQTTTGAGFTGNFITFTGSSTTGTGNLVLVTGANTTAGAMLRFTNNALTTGVGIIYAHTASVIADGGSMLRLSSTSVDTGGATNGTILDLGSTGSLAGTLVKMTDTALTTGTGMLLSHSAMTTGIMLSVLGGATLTTGNLAKFYDNSADTSARSLVFIHSDSATASMAVTPLALRNDSKTNTNFAKLFTGSNSTQTFTLWMSDAATSPNASLVATTGDVCVNADSGKSYYCTNGAGALWTSF